MYNELDLCEIKAEGWVKEYLLTQARGMTGHLDKVGEPFSGKYWDEDEQAVLTKMDRFLGGLNSKNDAWVPFEQTGYWIDGMVRAAYLTGDEELLEKVQPKINNPIKFISEDGFIGPDFMKDNIVWAHAVYFRALIAAYTATKDEKILEALKKHFLRVPLKDVYKKHEDLRIISVRDICDIETALWLYGQTEDARFLKMAEESYQEFNRIYVKDRGVSPHCKMKGVTLKGMLSDDKANNNHGVTYCEVCKLAAILHKYTGKEIYKQAAIKAFDKAYRDNMIVDGVISSSEYLNGNKNSNAVHETCDVSDFTWAVGYLFMITGDAKYGDWIENAIFNGGLASVDDDFTSNQYFTCPNQVVCDDHSNHAGFYKGEAWMSYAPEEIMGCCTGNVNRFMPNYVCRSWMKDEEQLCAFLYAPSSIETVIKGVKVKVDEITKYPFENKIQFCFEPEKSVKFTFMTRIPEWAKKCVVSINGTEKIVKDTSFFSVNRKFEKGDVIELQFEDAIEFIPNAGGVSVKKGALLYALPVKERVVIEETKRGLGDPMFPHYSLYGESQWNYGVLMEKQGQARFTPSEKIADTPWKSTSSKHNIYIQGCEVADWKLHKTEKIRQKLHPRKHGKIVQKECLMMPKVQKKGVAATGEVKELQLVPYCTTRLRVAIFPIITQTHLHSSQIQRWQKTT